LADIDFKFASFQHMKLQNWKINVI